ncbi:MAG: putative Ig domain-containing protein [Nitrospirae bacterium]|nr:putative Ig domain-containing protein [Nitrospirota bacterium]
MNGKIKKLVTRHSSLVTVPNGFTLIELAIVLVIVGMLVGLGASMMGPLTKRAKLHETREIVKSVYESLMGYAARNKNLPATLASLGVRTTDAYNRPLVYNAITFANLCTNTGTYITVNDNSSGTMSTQTDIAFIVLGEGENRCNQTGVASPFAIAVQDTVTACVDGSDPNAFYDDIVMYQDINAIRDKICNVFKIVTDSLPTGTEETAYPDSNLEATDGTTPYTWSILSGSLPSGLSLQNRTSGTCGSAACTLSNPCGCITGMPTMDGSFNFTVNVADNETPNRTATKSLSITINPNDPRITTEFLTYCTVNQPYPGTTLSASGGKPSYTWALAGGSSLPTGLNLNATTGEISGTPTVAGTYPFTITVTDSGSPSRSTSKTLSIAINPLP